MNLLYEKLAADAIAPQKAHELDSGYDVFLNDIKEINGWDLSKPSPIERLQGAHEKGYWEKGRVITLHPGDRVMVGTGLKLCVDTDIVNIAGVACTIELQVRPRSGTSRKKNLLVINSPGTIDNQYRGEACILLQNNAYKQNIDIVVGEKIAQIVPSFVPLLRLREVTSLPENTDRGAKGFGSSGA
jgi:dUTP pyrophosphatase